MNECLAHEPKPTDRGAWRLVAVRDFRVRLRDKGFFISTGITLTVLTVFILLRAFGDEVTPSFDLGIIGRDPAAIDRTVAELDDVAEREGVELRVGHWDDVTDAEAAVRSGRLDAVLDGDELVGDDAVPATLTRLVQNALIRVRITAALEGGGASAAQIEAVLHQPSVDVRTLEPQDPEREENDGIAFIAVLLAYGQLFGYGVWVATGVIEEKASRVVEILLSAIRARQLLAGKIAGIGLLGHRAARVIAAFASDSRVVTGALDFPGHGDGRGSCSCGS